ncbi:hypothetical protein [Helicobacter monodelphidis]|uniref:hypothetical protein n=1 Tax=Helicobacter sp. 15-1451 TaxID=2004995 RepID=UPI00215BA453|nr:hypothetical protein [Helicobacter sp. 15-1451]
MKGYHNPDRDRGLGAEHIKLHLDDKAQGAISIEELVNLGNSLREYTKKFKEPYIDDRNAKIYEWENDDGVRFRAIVDKIPIRQMGGPQLPLSPSNNQIITFYSDRNLNTRMVFKNPQVDSYYTQTPQSTEDSILQRALELQTKQQKGELENFFTHQEENTNESKSKKGEKQS